MTESDAPTTGPRVEVDVLVCERSLHVKLTDDPDDRCPCGAAWVPYGAQITGRDALVYEVGRTAAIYQEAEDAFNAEIDRRTDGGEDRIDASCAAARLPLYQAMLDANGNVDAALSALRALDAKGGPDE